MKISVITIFPQLIQDTIKYGVLGQAIDKEILSVETVNPRDFTSDVHKTVDDRPFGGGDGMIMLYEPLKKSVESLGTSKNRVVYLSPQGAPLNLEKVQELSRVEHLVLVCGRYGGVDQRFINDFIDEEISIGDYVMSGGEPAAFALIDSVSRFLPGVLGHENSAVKDSFHEQWLEAPLFTRPQKMNEATIPAVLLSGHHENIEKWRFKVGQLVTLQKRPDLFWSHSIGSKELSALKKFCFEMSAPEREMLHLQNLTEKDFEQP